MLKRLEEFLATKQARFQLVTHPGGLSAQEQAAMSHTSGWAMAKVVIVKERDGLVMAVLPAACALDLDRLKGLIGHGHVQPAPVDEIEQAIPDCLPGSIPAFGALWGLRTFADRRVFDARDVTMPAGEMGRAIRMPTTEYRRLATPRVGDFAVPESLLAAGGVRRARPRRRAG
jgi:Ala-tRNA(Pro) deacylase